MARMQAKPCRMRTWGAPLFITMAWTALPALAQTAPAIIVTAPGGTALGAHGPLLSADDLQGPAGPDVLRALSTHIAGVSLSDAQGNEWQPSLIYHGFSASALQGDAQGLAVYVDGGRFNLPFGDTVNLDLLPDNALHSVAVRESNPVYGLNALGGALVIATHTGRTAPGLTALAALGDHDRREAQLSLGHQAGNFSLFAAGQVRHDGGWRDHSPSNVYHGFADAGWDGATAGLHIKFLAANTDLTGNGATPLSLLVRRRGAVLTYPDGARNRLLRGSVHPWIGLDDQSRLEASLYVQTWRQRTANGDLADIAPCDEDPQRLCLDRAGGQSAPLFTVQGQSVPNDPAVDRYGVFNRTRTRSDGGGLVLQYVRRQNWLGVAHDLAFGINHDQAMTRFGASSELGQLLPERALIGLGPILRQPDGAIAPIGLDVRNWSTGLFFADHIQLSDRLSTQLGVRWNATQIHLIDRLGDALNGQHRFRRIDPGMAWRYTLSPAATISLGYAQTSRTPTPAELSCADAAAPCSLTNFFVADPPLAQIVAQNWTGGLSRKWAGAGWRGQWTITLYRTGIAHDLRLTAAETRGRGYFRDIGATRRQGIDVHWDARQGPWSVSLGYAYTAAQFRTAFTAVSMDNPRADETGQIAVAPGSHVPGIPAHRAVLNLAYAPSDVTIRGAVHAQSRQWRSGDEGNLDSPVPGFMRVDLGADLPFGRHMSGFVDVTNVLNSHYATFGTYSQLGAISDTAAGARAITPAAPRRLLLGLKFRP